VPTLDPPLLQVSEETGYWYTNITPIYVQYNSNDPLYGMDLGKWPAELRRLCRAAPGAKACKRVTGSSELLKGPTA
jgi:hypothetical protein